MKRVIWSISLVVVLVLAMGLGLGARAADGVFRHGDGTLGNPFLIADAEDILRFAAEDGRGRFYALERDIVLTAPWTPIDSFDGFLDGRGFTISGIDIQETTTQSASGFFRRLGEQGVVANLVLEGKMTLTAQGTEGIAVGGLTGISMGHIENCHSNIQIVIESTVGHVNGGGLVGINEGTLSGCSAIGDVEMKGTAMSSALGGLVGRNRGVAANGYAAGEALSAVESEYWVGGVIGYTEEKAQYAGLYWCTDALQMAGGAARTTANRVGIGNIAADGDNIGISRGLLKSQGFANDLNGGTKGHARLETVWTWNADVYHGYPYSGETVIEEAEGNSQEEEPAAPGVEEPQDPLLPSQELLPIDLREIVYRIDGELMVILSPTGEQMAQIVENAVNQQILIDLSAFVGATGLGLELTDMDWWFDGNGDKLTILLATGEAVTISDKMFDNPAETLSRGNILMKMKKNGLIVSFTQNGAPLSWENPSDPLIISLPYAISPAQNPDRLVVAENPGGGEPQHVIPRSWYDEKEDRVYAKVYSGGSYDAKYSVDVVYADVAGKWMEEAVNYTTARGVIAEKANGFAPDDTVTRVEFIRMFMRLLDVDITDYNGQGFADEYAIPGWGIDSVNKALEMGIITGDANGNFNPLEEITRQDMMVIIHRALDILGMIPADLMVEDANFTDMGQVKGYAVDAVNTLAALDLVHGYNGNINPDGVATRGEVVQMFYNILAWDALAR